jgi:enoyl-CoA hydratase
MSPVATGSVSESSLRVKRKGFVMTITLNRPEALNTLNLEVVRRIRRAMDEGAASDGVRLILLRGAGGRAFCAGGDIKFMSQAVRDKDVDRALRFLREEYDLDLLIHGFPKPVVVMAHGITMGGGLGLAAGADLVVATEQTRMAMPETRIGFFPDVGATGWMFAKCPPGFPEFLGLTGYEMRGAECVRLGFADCLLPSAQLDEAIAVIERAGPGLPHEKDRATKEIRALLEPVTLNDIPSNPDMDQWVREYFKGKSSVPELLNDLRQCSIQGTLCDGVFASLSERSPTGVVLTLALLRHNERRPMESVFQTDIAAARFMLTHHDFAEGVRARLLDKDDNPQWRPARFEDVGPLDLGLYE